IRWWWRFRGWLFRLAGRLRRNGHNGLGQYLYRAAIGIGDLGGAAGVGDNCVDGAGLSRVVNHTVALPPVDQDLTLQDLHGGSEGGRGRRHTVEERNEGQREPSHTQTRVLQSRDRTKAPQGEAILQAPRAAIIAPITATNSR